MFDLEEVTRSNLTVNLFIPTKRSERSIVSLQWSPSYFSWSRVAVDLALLPGVDEVVPLGVLGDLESKSLELVHLLHVRLDVADGQPLGFWEVLGCSVKIISMCNVGC